MNKDAKNAQQIITTMKPTTYKNDNRSNRGLSKEQL